MFFKRELIKLNKKRVLLEVHTCTASQDKAEVIHTFFLTLHQRYHSHILQPSARSARKFLHSAGLFKELGPTRTELLKTCVNTVLDSCMASVPSQGMTVHFLLASRAMYGVSPFPAVDCVIITGFFLNFKGLSVFFSVIWIALSSEQGSETFPFEGM